MRWLCGTGQLPRPTRPSSSVPTIDPSDLNHPTIAIGALAGTQTITRTVTAVSSKGSSNYTPKIVKPAGVDVSVTPKVLKVKPNRTATYTVTFTRTSAAFDEYAFENMQPVNVAPAKRRATRNAASSALCAFSRWPIGIRIVR